MALDAAVDTVGHFVPRTAARQRAAGLLVGSLGEPGRRAET